MIIIKTANGDSFINETEVKATSHDKERACVLVVFKDGKSRYIFQVESMTYTNKDDTEIRDNGLMMDGAVSDAEYFKQLNASSEEVAKRLYSDRTELEFFILNHKDIFTSDYDKRFVERIQEARQKRPNSIQGELDKVRDYPYYTAIRKKAHQTGEETAKEFTRMTKKIEDSERWQTRYKEANDRIMQRNLWQRIINEKTYL